MPHSPENRNLVIYDQRPSQTLPGDIVLGHNGYVIATFEGQKLVLNYFDNRGGLNGKLLEEQWSVNEVTGKITGDFIKDLTADGKNTAQQQLSPFIGADLNDAITPLQN